MIATTHRQHTPRRSWWGRSTGVSYDRPAAVLAVLQHARAIVESGWVQNRWTVATPAAAAAVATSVSADATAGGATAACVVGAVALAVRARDPRADLAVATGPALAHLWDVVHGGGPGRPAAGRSAPHDVRVARMRELARWNDQPGRTRADVLAALDRAAAHVVAMTVEPARV